MGNFETKETMIDVLRMDKSLYINSLVNENDKNEVGSLATNFIYTLLNGSFNKMHQINAEYLLLFFCEPLSLSSYEIQQAIENSNLLNKLQKNDRLKVCSVYAGTNMRDWWKYSKSIPKEWINGFNCFLRKDHEYNLSVLPTLYLLNREKQILLKDTTIELIEQQLEFIERN